MKKNEIVILAVKLLGIFITIQGLSSFTATFGQNGFHGIDNWSLYLGFLIYLLSGLILLFKAETLSAHILPLDESTVTELNISENFQTAALRIVGIYISIFAIPALIHLTGKMIQYEFFGSEIPEYLKEKPYYIVPLISQTVYFLMGLFLAMGPSAIIKVLSRFDKTIEKMST
jgi:hypothetical protein